MGQSPFPVIMGGDIWAPRFIFDEDREPASGEGFGRDGREKMRKSFQRSVMILLSSPALFPAFLKRSIRPWIKARPSIPPGAE